MKSKEKDTLGPARKMGEFISDVVCAATVSPKGNRKQSAIRCRKRPGHKACPGRIIVYEQDNGNIEWACSSCDFKGVIRGWQGGWSDLSDFRHHGEPPFFELVLSEKQYDELKKYLAMDVECDAIIYSAIYSKKGIVLRACGTDMKILGNCLEIKTLEHNIMNHRILAEILTGIQVLLGRWNSG